MTDSVADEGVLSSQVQVPFGRTSLTESDKEDSQLEYDPNLAELEADEDFKKRPEA